MRINGILSLVVVVLLSTVIFASAVNANVTRAGGIMQFRYNARNTGDNVSIAQTSASTGQLNLSYANRGAVYSSPTVTNGIVYVGSYDHNVYALNATTGAKVWNYSTKSHVYSSPIVFNGIVYVGSDDHNVYALNAATGAKVWNYTLKGVVSYSWPAIANGIVYVGTGAGVIYALNATAGAKVWNYDTGGSVFD